MAEMLESIMTRSYESLKDELRLDRNHSLLKTYIIEAHTAARANHDELFQIMQGAFLHSNSQKTIPNITIKETQEEDLFVVRGSSRQGLFTFYIDTTDPRFWLTHAVAKSSTSDRAVDNLLSGSSSLDSAWMPIELLESVMKLGTSRGIGLDFDRRILDKEPVRSITNKPLDPHPDGRIRENNPISTNTHLEYAKMQLWGSGADRILDALKEAKLTNSTTLSKVRLRNEDEGDSEMFALSDIKFDGKVTGRGTSFDTYNSVLLAVRSQYSKVIHDTESTFRLDWDGAEGKPLKGEPFHIMLGEYGISNLEHFCARVFSGLEPFRLMGLPIRRNSNFYTASAIDLHVNQKLDFEISRKKLTAYLPKNACGNTLLRLYTNLQHFFSSDVKAIYGSGEAVFNI